MVIEYDFARIDKTKINVEEGTRELVLGHLLYVQAPPRLPWPGHIHDHFRVFLAAQPINSY